MQAFRQSNFRHHITRPPEPQRSGHRVIWLTLLAVIVATGGYVLVGHGQAKKASSEASKTHTQTTQATTTPVGNACAVGTAAGKYILVSISERHLWACDGTALAYNSAVVTGMESLAADLTPPGTYHIYAKSTNLYLKGHDSTGSWNDYVNYFMPFLDDKYGIYVTRLRGNAARHRQVAVRLVGYRHYRHHRELDSAQTASMLSIRSKLTIPSPHHQNRERLHLLG